VSRLYLRAFDTGNPDESGIRIQHCIQCKLGRDKVESLITIPSRKTEIYNLLQNKATIFASTNLEYIHIILKTIK
jgi:hypothetical protein